MLSIGDFARLVGVSVRMLRHYDSLGILTPARVDEWTGYRYYAASQVTRANRLVALRELGFGLEEVGTLLDAPSGTVRALLIRRRQELRAQVDADTRRLSHVEARLRLIEKGTTMTEYTEASLPALTLTGRQLTTAAMSAVEQEIGPLFDRVNGAIREAGVTLTGPGVATYDASSEAGMVVTVGEQVGSAEVPGLERIEVPGVERALITRLEGADLTGIQSAWQSLVQEAERRGLTLAGPGREVYVETPFDGPEATGWVVDLQQPVA
ncbi:MerR family transcriptional regulator [Serinibacter salmoneus]|uniref:DNA-binding transcriptional MerR regulator n=1 Tax=Serinibacter salmoneus TaxID=556530 RepID=A0A2A9CYT9_9MICO|nr:MerR family transcriptional regulator [Serinibacter salmoneus]PFG18749.1 DNA-binding transcriptional MerR regulator [Serinibacter salmoneus]